MRMLQIQVINFSAKNRSDTMEISQSVYGLVFVYSVVIGAILGVVYDVFRIQRITMKSENGISHLNIIKDIIILVEDIIFAVISAVVIIIMIFHVNNGRIRWFALFGTGIGFLVYYNTIGRIIMICSEKIISFIRYCIRMIKKFIYKVFIRPVILLCKFIAGLIYVRYMKNKNKLYTKKYMSQMLRNASEGFFIKGGTNV